MHNNLKKFTQRIIINNLEVLIFRYNILKFFIEIILLLQSDLNLKRISSFLKLYKI